MPRRVAVAFAVAAPALLGIAAAAFAAGGVQVFGGLVGFLVAVVCSVLSVLCGTVVKK
jgi:hypothetical protein